MSVKMMGAAWLCAAAGLAAALVGRVFPPALVLCPLLLLGWAGCIVAAFVTVKEDP